MKVAFAAILLCLTALPVRAQLNPRERCLAEATAKGSWVPPRDGPFRPTAKANCASAQDLYAPLLETRSAETRSWR
jgi:hypothetical protein